VPAAARPDIVLEGYEVNAVIDASIVAETARVC
jgi:hypothetical protein